MNQFILQEIIILLNNKNNTNLIRKEIGHLLCSFFSLFFFASNLIRSYLFRLPFLQLWAVFAVLFLLTDIVWSWLFKMVSGMWVSASFWFVQYLIVCLIYPFFMWLTGHVNQRIKEEG